VVWSIDGIRERENGILNFKAFAFCASGVLNRKVAV
jgi:hypothetical protein